jgi:hypothetical protein
VGGRGRGRRGRRAGDVKDVEKMSKCRKIVAESALNLDLVDDVGCFGSGKFLAFIAEERINNSVTVKKKKGVRRGRWWLAEEGGGSPRKVTARRTLVFDRRGS